MGIAGGILAVIVAVYFYWSVSAAEYPSGPPRHWLFPLRVVERRHCFRHAPQHHCPLPAPRHPPLHPCCAQITSSALPTNNGAQAAAEREELARTCVDEDGKAIGTAADFQTWFRRVEKLQVEIHGGAKAFLFAEYRYLVVFCILVAAALCGILYQESEPLAGLFTAICFLVGALLSGSAGYVGMLVATEANSRTAYQCTKSMKAGLEVSFASGAVMSNSVVGFGILGVSVLYVIFSSEPLAWQYLSGFGFGASSIALFARVGGGIFTKAADVGADLVGKVDSGIPEDDPRNPATIADNVGDNVGDVAGMGADLFESFVGGIIATATLAVSQSTGDLANAEVALPFWVAGFGIMVALIGTVIVRTYPLPNKADLDRLLLQINLGIFTSAFLVVIMSIVACGVLFGFENELAWRYFGCLVVGLVAGLVVGSFTEYCTSYEKDPTRYISESAKFGTAPVIIMGLGVGMVSVTVPTLALCAAILGCNALGGLYGVSLSSVGLLATLGITLATDAYGPVADNAGGIAEMAGMHESIRGRTDALDSLGNTTAATGKGFAIGSAVLTSVGLIAAFLQQSGVIGGTNLSASLDKPVVLAGVLIGAMLPFVFAALTMLSVNKAAQAIIAEVRRQFSACPELLRLEEGSDEIYEPHTGSDGKSYPNSANCVAIATTSAVAEMVLPGVAAIFAPVIVGFLLGTLGLAGLLVGALSSGFMLALTMSNAGGAWDNAKKWVEKCAREGEDHAASKFTKYGIKKGSVFNSFDATSVKSIMDFAPIATDEAAAAVMQEHLADTFTQANLKDELLDLYHNRHSAVVNGDTVGDPFKDTSGPALNILIKLMSVISLVLAPAFKNLGEHEGFGPTGWWIALIVAVVIAILCIVFVGCVNNANRASQDALSNDLNSQKLELWTKEAVARSTVMAELKAEDAEDAVATAVDQIAAIAVPALLAGVLKVEARGATKDVPATAEETFKLRESFFATLLPSIENRLGMSLSKAGRKAVIAKATAELAAGSSPVVEDKAAPAEEAAAAAATAAAPAPAAAEEAATPLADGEPGAGAQA